MAGYSGTPLIKKLGLKPGIRAYLIGATYKVPAGVKAVTGASRRDPVEFIHIFSKERADLEGMIPILRAVLAPAGMLWVSWPKRASKVPTDLDENIIRKIGLKAGLVDVKVCAVDDVWSGLKFVIRLKNR